MASATERTSAESNGGATTATISVENPATGELITTVPVLGADDLAGAWPPRHARPSPRWERPRLRGPRPQSCAGPRSGCSTTPTGCSACVVRESRQDLRGRPAGRPRLHRHRARLLGQGGRRAISRTSECRRGTTPWPRARSSSSATCPIGRGRRDRAVELPDRQFVRRLHPGAGGRQQRACSSPAR